MTIIGDTNARWTGTQVGDEREQVIDNFVDLSPDATPLLATINRGERLITERVQWFIQSIGGYPASSSDIDYLDEGDDFTISAGVDRYRLYNDTEILGRAYSVTETQQAIARNGGLYAIEDELDNQNMNATRMLLRQFEWTIINGVLAAESNTSPNDSANTGRRMGGLVDFVKNFNNYVTFSSQAASIPTEAKPYSTSLTAALTAADIEAQLRNMAERGGVDGRVFAICPPSIKAQISDLFAPRETSTSIFRRRFGSESDIINLRVDEVQTDFGIVEFMWHLGMPANTILFYNPEYIELRVLRDIQTHTLAKVADDIKEAVVMEAAITILAPNTVSLMENVT